MSRILVVDDERDILLLLQETLTGCGHTVTGAVSGAEAMDFLVRQELDLLILDLRMPDFSGIDLLHWVRERYKGLPVIVCTAYPALKNDFTLWESHVAAFVTKPIDMPNLIAEVSQALGQAGTDKQAMA